MSVCTFYFGVQCNGFARSYRGFRVLCVEILEDEVIAGGIWKALSRMLLAKLGERVAER